MPNIGLSTKYVYVYGPRIHLVSACYVHIEYQCNITLAIKDIELLLEHNYKLSLIS